MFQLQQHLDDAFHAIERRFAFHANTPSELAAWQAAFRAELSALIGLAQRPAPAHPQADLLERIDKGSYWQEKYALALDDVAIPLYLLVPKTAPPYPALLAFHGHGPGVQLILGNDPDPATHAANVALDENFAQRFAAAGYLVCAIEQRGFGERLTAQTTIREQFPNSCQHLAFEYLLAGKVLLGERVRDGLASLNYLLNRPDVLNGVVHCTGHSGGGTTALFTSALEPRLQSVVISGYFCSYKASILGMSHCECNYVPKLLTLGDVGEIAALIAPRRLRLVNGSQDPLFPIAGVAEPYQVVQQAYAAAGAPQACSLVLHPGAHRYDFELSRTWFDAAPN